MRMKLKIGHYASYLQIKELQEGEKVNYTKEVFKDIYCDFDKDHNLIGIEFLEEVKISYYDDYKRKTTE